MTSSSTKFKTYDEWLTIWMSLSSDELDSIALLRVMECTNGVIQYMWRDDAPDKLSIEQTRKAMNFSMSSIKNLEIQIGDEVITFSEKTKEYLREARDLYIRAFKKGEEEAVPAFFNCSETTVKVVGEHRILEAANKIDQHLTEFFPKGTAEWGVMYLRRFMN